MSVLLTSLPFVLSFLKPPNVGIFQGLALSWEHPCFPQLEVSSRVFICLLWHLTTLWFHYITVAYVPYDFNVLRNVDHDPQVSIEIPAVGHDLNF